MTNVFVGRSGEELGTWMYCYDCVIAVFDYGEEGRGWYWEEGGVFVEKVGRRGRGGGGRAGFLGRPKPGKYFKMGDKQGAGWAKGEGEDWAGYIMKMVRLRKTKEDILASQGEQFKKKLETTWDLLVKHNILPSSLALRSYYCSPLLTHLLLSPYPSPSTPNLFLYLISLISSPCPLQLSPATIQNKTLRHTGDISLFL